jgi:hypothetical protein
MKLIAFTGLPRSGKDTAAERLARRWNYRILRFSDPLKEAAAILLRRPEWQMRGDLGFDREAVMPEWGFSVRYFLQRFGTEAMRDNFGADFWVKLMRARLAGMDRVVITDCRFENEAKMVRELGGIVAEIYRPACAGSSHISDAGISLVDWTIDNSSTPHDFYTRLDAVVHHYHHYHADFTL